MNLLTFSFKLHGYNHFPMKDHGWDSPSTLNSVLIVVARGDRRIDWVRHAGGSGVIYKTLSDSRMVDPISVEYASLGRHWYVLRVGTLPYKDQGNVSTLRTFFPNDVVTPYYGHLRLLIQCVDGL